MDARWQRDSAPVLRREAVNNSDSNNTTDDDKVDDTVRCKECGHNEWVCRYGDYELWGTCAKCGNVESLYSG
jgi:hypothetical protein